MSDDKDNGLEDAGIEIPSSDDSIITTIIPGDQRTTDKIDTEFVPDDSVIDGLPSAEEVDAMFTGAVTMDDSQEESEDEPLNYQKEMDKALDGLEQEEEETDQKERPILEEDQSSSNVELTADPVTVSDEKFSEQDLMKGFLAFLSKNIAEINELSTNWPNTDGTSGKFGQLWYNAFENGVDGLTKGDSFNSSVKRPESQWRQSVEAEGQTLQVGKPRFNQTDGAIISGERAVLKTMNALGFGSIVQIPLWHTGIWISLKPPSEGALLELERRIAMEKVELGRATAGMVYSNTSVYTISHLINFAFNHVYDATVKNITPDALKEMISITDIPLILWGLACTIYPNGYNYARPCTTDPTKCQHVVKGLISLPKLQWTDTSSLTDSQRKHMANRGGKFTDEEIKRYQSEHSRGGNKVIPIRDSLKFRLKVPTIAEYERSGFNWVDNIIKLLEGSLGVSLRGEQRDDYIRNQARLSAIRQYGHWIDQIEVGEDFIEDTDTIEAVISNLSSDEAIYNTFIEEVGKYIDSSTISLIAIPKYSCPKCGSPQEDDSDSHSAKHPHLLPIDMTRTFFTLLDQRITKALTAEKL